jgi:uncharacterized membrane protein
VTLIILAIIVKFFTINSVLIVFVLKLLSLAVLVTAIIFESFRIIKNSKEITVNNSNPTVISGVSTVIIEKIIQNH